MEYVAQSYLGSLSSVGAGSGLITNLANAIGALGSGNIEGLSSNSGMLNLIVMAA